MDCWHWWFQVKVLLLHSSVGQCAMQDISSLWLTLSGCAAEDEAGNASPTLQRHVYIDASCPDGKQWCAETGVCEQVLLCMPKLTTANTYMPAKVAYAPPVDDTPPTLELLTLPGDLVMNPATPGPHIVVTTATLGEAEYVDPRWKAVDNVDGDISARASSVGLSAVSAAARSSVPTPPEAPMTISYNVIDAAGNSARAIRLVHLSCGGGEASCTAADGSPSCTVEGICNQVVQKDKEFAVPATVKLLGPQEVFIPVGQRYVMCSTDMPLGVLCDQVHSQPCNSAIEPVLCFLCEPQSSIQERGSLLSHAIQLLLHFWALQSEPQSSIQDRSPRLQA
jgi:hypothetical protein